jgi:FAD/FMN-containing dehydrogenase
MSCIFSYPDPALSREDAQRLYYGEKVPKLREIKRKYDPNNLFQFPHSILP